LNLREADYPFDSGWIPEDVHSVQFNVRSGGHNSFAIEKLSINRTKWNYPLLDRVREARTSDRPQLPFPNPQFISRYREFDREKFQSGCVRFNGIEPNNSIKEAIELIGLHLNRDGCTHPSLEVTVGDLVCHGEPQCETARQRFEAYVLRPNSNSTVALFTATEAGLSYGLDTLHQLISPSLFSGMFPEVIDYPTFEWRAVTGNDPDHTGYRNEREAPQWLREARLNRLMVEIDAHDPRWWRLSSELRVLGLDLERQLQGRSDLKYGIHLNPYAGRFSDTEPRSFVLSDRKTQRDLYATIDWFRRHGASSLMLRADDLVPEERPKSFRYHLDQINDQKLFGSLGRAHHYLTSQAASTFPTLEQFFCPPWYNLWFAGRQPEMSATYFNELNLPVGAALVTTGPTVRSFFVEDPQMTVWKKVTKSMKVVLWDNTLFARRHKDFWLHKASRVDLLSFFEPYDVQIGMSARESMYGVFLNSQFSERSRIQLATAGAYLWNPGAYHPEHALWTYLERRFGTAAADRLLVIDQLLWSATRAKLSGDVESMRNSVRSASEHLTWLSSQNVPSLSPLIIELQTKVQQLTPIV